MNQKKRHHFVPKAYLRSFCDGKSRVIAYRKDNPAKALHVDPDGIGFERFYYAQPKPEGGLDTNRLEDLFSIIETEWPQVVARMHNRENVNDALELIFEFMALQRIRVPASRDVTEARLAVEVKKALLQHHAQGQIPPFPAGLDISDIEVSIDPHQSIHGMVRELQTTVAKVFDRIGICVIHNLTSRQFLTSDNPVIWFDPTHSEEELRPYAVREDGPVMLLFPLSPTLLLMGSTEHKAQFSQQGLLYGEAPGEDWVGQINTETSRYAYETVFAQRPGEESVIEKYSAESPVFDETADDGRMKFGKRVKLPKWRIAEDSSPS